MIINVKTSNSSYDIKIGRGLLDTFGDTFKVGEKKVLIVTDSGVPKKYAECVKSSVKNGVIFTFPMGEKNKNFSTLQSILKALIENGFSRHDAVVAVGGGVCGDMAGFAASIFMRGIDFFNIPTTVLSQVDSSIGGKTAIDFCGVKNSIGAFFAPKGVLIDLDTLDTLDSRLVSEGLAESIKMGVTSDEKLFEIFEGENYLLRIDEIIERSLMVKKGVVEKDEKESGLRKMLNFGHTLGHAVESAVSLGTLFHGECVALGMLPMCDEKIRGRVKNALLNVNLPVKFDFDENKAFFALTHDKKTNGKKVTLVKSEKIGTFFFEDCDILDVKPYLSEIK